MLHAIKPLKLQFRLFSHRLYVLILKRRIATIQHKENLLSLKDGFLEIPTRKQKFNTSKEIHDNNKRQIIYT